MATCGTIPSSVSGSSSNLPMGIGKLGTTQLKRKFRFLFSIDYCNFTKNVPPDYVKTASKPSFTVEETQLDFLNERIWIPGKGIWDTVAVTYYDAADQTALNLYNWIASVYDFSNTCRFQNSNPDDYGGTGQLISLDGCGNVLDWWTMFSMWPQNVKFGDLDMSSSDVNMIELTLRYAGADYQSICPSGSVTPCACSPCSA